MSVFQKKRICVLIGLSLFLLFVSLPFSSFAAEFINAEETDDYTNITEIDDRVFETETYTVTVSLKMV